jgi:hypothetical protein
MKVLALALTLMVAADAWASCVVHFETVDEQDQALPAVKVWLEAESCQYKSESRLADARGAGQIDGVPSGCQFIAHGEFDGGVIHPISGACGSSEEPIRLTYVEPHHVSLIRVLANPEVFDGVYVRVTGVLMRQFEGNALYVDLQSLKHAVHKNAIYLDFRPDQWLSMQGSSKQYVTLTGRFNAKNLGHAGAFSGQLEDIQ